MLSEGNEIKTTMQPTNGLMEFREIEKKTVLGIKVFWMNSSKDEDNSRE